MCSTNIYSKIGDIDKIFKEHLFKMQDKRYCKFIPGERSQYILDTYTIASKNPLGCYKLEIYEHEIRDIEISKILDIPNKTIEIAETLVLPGLPEKPGLPDAFNPKISIFEKVKFFENRINEPIYFNNIEFDGEVLTINIIVSADGGDNTEGYRFYIHKKVIS